MQNTDYPSNFEQTVDEFQVRDAVSRRQILPGSCRPIEPD